MFIEIEDTPNPRTLKFVLNPEMGRVSDGVEFLSVDEAVDSPLATLLFGIHGVEKVFLGGDFVSITRSSNIEWEGLRPEVLLVLTEYFLREKSSGSSDVKLQEEEKEFFDVEDTELVSRLKELIDSYVKPAVAEHGGDIRFVGYKDNVVFVRLRGACSGCPSAAATLKDGVYGMLSYYIPEVKAVENV